MKRDWLRLVALALAFAWALWWTLFGLASGIGEGYGPVGIFMHTLFPGLLFMANVLLAWRWEFVGAFLLLGDAALTLGVFAFARTPAGFFSLTLPPLFAGLCLLLNGYLRRIHRTIGHV
jgi:hypothetical protein